MYSIGQVSDATNRMQSALETNPNFARAESAKSFLQMNELAADPAKAVAGQAQVRATLKEQPDYVPALMAAATIYRQQGNLDAAKQACAQALARFPLFTPANKQLALLYLQPPVDYDKVFEHASKAREAYAGDAEVAKALGLAVYQRKDYQRAAQLLKQAAVQRGTDGELQYYLGMAHYQLKQSSDSKAALQKAVTLDANAPYVADAKKILAELK